MNFNNGGVIGGDVSFYQDLDSTPQQINFSKMIAQGATFVIIRGGQAIWPDPDFEYNWREAKDAGLARGSYWYYDAAYEPKAQARLFAALFKTDKPELELWLDLEGAHSEGIYSGYVNWKKFLDELRLQLPDVKIGIYTGYYYITGKIPNSEFIYFSGFPLWLAWYTKDINGNFYPIPGNVQYIPKPWTSCLYWQWGTPVWGITWGCESQEIDQSIFNGTKEQFLIRYNLSGGQIPMEHYFKVTPNISGEYRSIRNPEYPNVKGAKIGQINPYSFAKCSTDDVINYTSDVTDGIYLAKAGDKWLHVYEANGLPIDGWVAEIHLGKRYLNVEEFGVPVGLPTINVTLEAEGYPTLTFEWVPNP